MPENAVFQRGEWMFDRRSSQSHRFRRGALLHSLQRTIVQMTVHQPLRGLSTATFQRTRTTCLRCRRIHNPRLLSLQLLARESLPRGTAKRVGRLVVVELIAVEQSSVALIVDGAVRRYVRQDALGFAAFGLLPVGITSMATTFMVCPSLPTASCAASAIGNRLRLSVASSVTFCATISACLASTAVCTL